MGLAGPEPGNAEREIADFAVPLPAAASPAAVARQLRTRALHAVTICGGTRPAWATVPPLVALHTLGPVLNLG